MKLYYKPGACSLAARIVLLETDQQYDLIKTDTQTGITEAGERFGDINPNGYVPAIKLADGAVITENAAILQYLADLAPDHRLAPANGTIERVRLQELLSFLSSELHKAFGPFFSGEDLSQSARQTAENAVARHVASIEQRLNDGRHYLLGQTYTVADSYAFVVLNWSNYVGIDLTHWPLAQAFIARVGAREATRNAMAKEGLIDLERAA